MWVIIFTYLTSVVFKLGCCDAQAHGPCPIKGQLCWCSRKHVFEKTEVGRNHNKKYFGGVGCPVEESLGSPHPTGAWTISLISPTKCVLPPPGTRAIEVVLALPPLPSTSTYRLSHSPWDLPYLVIVKTTSGQCVKHFVCWKSTIQMLKLLRKTYNLRSKRKGFQLPHYSDVLRYYRTCTPF